MFLSEPLYCLDAKHTNPQHKSTQNSSSTIRGLYILISAFVLSRLTCIQDLLSSF